MSDAEVQLGLKTGDWPALGSADIRVIPRIQVMGSVGYGWCGSGLLRTFCGLAMIEQTWLTVVEAAARVKSNRRTVERWIADGLQIEWRRDDIGRRYRVVELDTLLAWWRQKMQNSPVHQYRLRRMRAERGLPPLEIPKRVSAQPERSQEVAAPDAATTEPEVRMPTVRAPDEYDALSRVLKKTEPGCRDVDEFTADRIRPDEIPKLAAICAACDVLQQCAAFAAAERPRAGFWAGKSWQELQAAQNAA